MGVMGKIVIIYKKLQKLVYKYRKKNNKIFFVSCT